MNTWIENVDWYDAATAFKAGTHDVQWTSNGESWADASIFGAHTKYRIREKQRTITVTIPRPEDAKSEPSGFGWHEMAMQYKTTELAQDACKAIRKAMEQQL